MSELPAPHMKPAEYLRRLALNLASINEILSELVPRVCQQYPDDDEFTAMTLRILRDHSWSLGCSFQDQMPPADWELPPDFQGQPWFPEKQPEPEWPPVLNNYMPQGEK